MPAQLERLFVERSRPGEPALSLGDPPERRERVGDRRRVAKLARQRQGSLTECLGTIVVAQTPCEPAGLSQDGGTQVKGSRVTDGNRAVEPLSTFGQLAGQCPVML